MSIRSREDLMASLNSFIGENSSDDALALLDDVSDTYDDLHRRATDVDWEAKYNELDTEWRNRYKERFNEPYNDDNDDNNDNNFDTPKALKFENLFSTEE